MTQIYTPATNITARIGRRLTVHTAQRKVPFKLNKSIVTFSFDDCPSSVMRHGLKPLEREGWLSSVYVAGGLMGTRNHHGNMITSADAVAIHKSGHEIGGHTFSHMDLSQASLPRVLADIERNQTYLADIGIPSATTMAYPYGETSPSVKSVLAAQYDGMRGINKGLHTNDVDLNQIRSNAIFSQQGLTKVLKLIESLGSQPAWITLFTHDISPTPSQWGCTANDFEKVITAVKDSGADVLTMRQAIRTVKNNMVNFG